MKSSGVLTERRYAKLAADIRKLIEEGRGRAQKAVRQEMVETYWLIGRRIDQEGLTGKAGYGEGVFNQLGLEMNLDPTTLKRCVNFFNAYKCVPRVANLTWSHYRLLIPLQNAEERQWYEERASARNLNRDQLQSAVKKDLYARARKSGGKGRITLTRLKRPKEPTYVYRAKVARVIDGDTLLLMMDLGFQVWKEQRLRLAEIDTPEMKSPGGEGEAAKKYVQEQLARVEFVMVKTNKIDIYGRYVGHVFYSLTERDKDKIFTQGRYLNQELVDTGFAQVV